MKKTGENNNTSLRPLADTCYDAYGSANNPTFMQTLATEVLKAVSLLVEPSGD